MNEIKEIIKEAWQVSPRETIKTFIGLMALATGLALFAIWLWQVLGKMI